MQIVMRVLSAPVRSHLLWPSTRKRVALVAELMMFFCMIGSLQICMYMQRGLLADLYLSHWLRFRGLVKAVFTWDARSEHIAAE